MNTNFSSELSREYINFTAALSTHFPCVKISYLVDLILFGTKVSEDETTRTVLKVPRRVLHTSFHYPECSEDRNTLRRPHRTGGAGEAAATFTGEACVAVGWNLAIVDVERVDHVHDRLYDDAVDSGDGGAPLLHRAFVKHLYDMEGGARCRRFPISFKVFPERNLWCVFLIWCWCSAGSLLHHHVIVVWKWSTIF